MIQDTKTQTAPGRRANAIPGPDQNAAEPLAGATMAEPKNTGARAAKKTRRTETEPPPGAPADVMAVLRHGGTAALACAAASSAVSLFWLAILVGWPAALAWLLPASLDVYAGTSLYVGYRLPVRHPAAKTSRRNARFALSLSVACNAIYHALVLFGDAWPVWVHDTLLVAVSALPPIVVERLLHLRSKVGNGHTATPAQATATPAATGNSKTPATPPAVDREETPAPEVVAGALETPAAETAPATRRPAAAATARTRGAQPAAIPIRLIPSAEKEKIVAKMLAERGDDVALSEIADAIGTPHRSTAMKVRDRVIAAREQAPDCADEGSEEPEPALGAAS